MPKVTINMERHEDGYTVSKMRRDLAQMLCRLNGEQPVRFSFVATVDRSGEFVRDSSEIYPDETTVVYGELARPEND